MPVLPKKPKLADFQKYVAELEKERRFVHQDVIQKCLLLGEEVGELFKAIRKEKSLFKSDLKSKTYLIEDELADIFVYLCCIANRYQIDLEKAFLKKEEKNKTREWV